MERLTYNSIPSTERSNVNYRSKLDSKAFNKNQDDMLNDILDIYNKLNSVNITINEKMQMAAIENMYLRKKIEELENSIERINRTNTDSDIKSYNVYPSNIYSDNLNPILNDSISNCLTLLPVSSSSKINIADEVMDTVFIPPNLNIELSDENSKSHIVDVVDTNILKAFNSNNSDCWIRKIKTDNTVNEVTTTMVITIPENIVTTFDINEIAIWPFPNDSIIITNIESRISNKPYKTIPGFKDHSLYISGIGILNSPNIKFNFNNIEANQIRITFKQKVYTTVNGYREFYLGAKSIDIKCNKYNDEPGYFKFNIDIPSDMEAPTLMSVDPIYNNESTLNGNCVALEYYYRDENNQLHKITDRLPFKCPKNTIEIRGRVFHNDSIANISRFNYKIKNVKNI